MKDGAPMEPDGEAIVITLSDVINQCGAGVSPSCQYGESENWWTVSCEWSP